MRFRLWLEGAAPIVYHVTFYKNLSGIANEGIIPNYEPNWETRAFNSALGTFFSTTLENARFWINKLEMVGEHKFDDILERGGIPIILRFPFHRRGRWQSDKESDIGRNDYYTKRVIQPQSIQWWDGRSWKSVQDQQIDHTLFLRPDTNDKIFTGELVHKEKFEAFMNFAWIEREMPRELVVVSQPEDICREWRLCIADGKVIAGSRYMDRRVFDTEPGFPDEAGAFAEEVVKTWTPHSTLVMDIGLTEFGYRVIECGSINCCGFYECELRPVVKALSEIAEREYKERVPIEYEI